MALGIAAIVIVDANCKVEKSEREIGRLEIEEVHATTTTVKEETYRTLEVEATAYSATIECCGKTDGITFTGTRAKEGRTIAVDPDVIPLGSEVIINGQTYIAEDIGGAVKGNMIDIYFENIEDAVEFGRQELTILVKE